MTARVFFWATHTGAYNMLPKWKTHVYVSPNKATRFIQGILPFPRGPASVHHSQKEAPLLTASCCGLNSIHEALEDSPIIEATAKPQGFNGGNILSCCLLGASFSVFYTQTHMHTHTFWNI